MGCIIYLERHLLGALGQTICVGDSVLIRLVVSNSSSTFLTAYLTVGVSATRTLHGHRNIYPSRL